MIKVGQRFGRLVTLSRDRIAAVTFWQCKCDCGQIKQIRHGQLQSGRAKSCGCLRADVCRDLHRVHGMRGSAQQANNKTASRLITAFGETLTLAQWSARVGIKSNTIARRLKRGEPPERALTLKLHEAKIGRPSWNKGKTSWNKDKTVRYARTKQHRAMGKLT